MKLLIQNFSLNHISQQVLVDKKMMIKGTEKLQSKLNNNLKNTNQCKLVEACAKDTRMLFNKLTVIIHLNKKSPIESRII